MTAANALFLSPGLISCSYPSTHALPPSSKCLYLLKLFFSSYSPVELWPLIRRLCSQAAALSGFLRYSFFFCLWFGEKGDGAQRCFCLCKHTSHERASVAWRLRVDCADISAQKSNKAGSTRAGFSCCAPVLYTVCVCNLKRSRMRSLLTAVCTV